MYFFCLHDQHIKSSTTRVISLIQAVRSKQKIYLRITEQLLE